MVLAHILLAILCAGVLAPSNGRALDIQQVQGRGHVSPLLGQDVEGVEGVVTAVLSTGSRRGFFMQDPRPGGDGDPWTSDAVFVSTGTAAPMVAPGDAVHVSGRVAELRGGNHSLSVTQLVEASVVVTARGVPLPAPTTIGASGRAPPARIAPDIGGSVEGPAHRFDPVANAIDFDETLEGMRVRVAGAVAIGPRNSFGEIPILPDLGAGAGLRSARGAMVAGPDGGPPGRLVADDALIGSAAMPRARVGDRIEIMIEGHAFFQLASALRLAEALREIRPFWLEDVLRVDNIGTLADFRRQCRLPVAASEMLLGRASYLPLLEARAADYVMIDPTWAGGISETRRIIDLAQAHNIPATMHDCTGPMTLYAGLHCSVASRNVVLQETVRAHIRTIYERLIDRQPVIENGWLLPPADPGLGTAFLPELFKPGNHPVRRTG